MLGGVPYTESRCVLHTDESFMPRRRAAWACWNYLHPDDEVHDQRICGSYWMNLLQGIPGPVNYIVTLNPPRPVAADFAVRKATIRSSSCKTAWPLSEPTTCPSSPTRHPAAGPARTMSRCSG